MGVRQSATRRHLARCDRATLEGHTGLWFALSSGRYALVDIFVAGGWKTLREVVLGGLWWRLQIGNAGDARACGVSGWMGAMGIGMVGPHNPDPPPLIIVHFAYASLSLHGGDGHDIVQTVCLACMWLLTAQDSSAWRAYHQDIFPHTEGGTILYTGRTFYFKPP